MEEDDELDDELDDGEHHEVLDALERIAKDDANGLIDPAAVVAAARDPGSPLHGYFTWSDQAAAHQHRLSQARMLIRNFRIVVKNEVAPKYVSVRITSGDTTRRGYVSVERAIADPNLYEQALADAHRGMISYRNRIAGFRAVSAGRRPAIDRAITALDDAIEATRRPAPPTIQE